MSRDSGRDSTQDMERIRRGLEEFLRQEMQDMETGEEQILDHRAEPQFFTIQEERREEKGIDIIGMKKKTAGGRRRPLEDDYAEDWDSGEKCRFGRTHADEGRVESEKGLRHREVPDGKGRRGKTAGNLRGKRKERPSDSREREDKDNRKRGGKGENPPKGRKKKKSGFKRFLIVLALIVVLAGGGLYWLTGVAYGRMNYEGIESVAAEPMEEDGVINILLIGNDSRENGEDGRSDAMILLSVSNRTGKIYMTSLLRDMYVEIPGHDNNRLNAAYSFGGAELLMETVEQNFDMDVNRYILVNFEAFANLVDAVGGVDLELSSEEIEYVNGYLVEYNMLLGRPQGTDNMDTSVSGMVHLNGAQALAYSRNRYLGTDFGRTERQRKVLSAVIDKLPGAVLTNPGELIDGLAPNLTTNLTKNECFRLGLTAPKLLSYEIVQGSLPLEGTYQNATIRKMAVLEVDFETNKKYIRETIYGEGASAEAK